MEDAAATISGSANTFRDTFIPKPPTEDPYTTQVWMLNSIQISVALNLVFVEATEELLPPKEYKQNAVLSMSRGGLQLWASNIELSMIRLGGLGIANYVGDTNIFTDFNNPIEYTHGPLQFILRGPLPQTGAKEVRQQAALGYRMGSGTELELAWAHIDYTEQAQ